MSLDNCSDENGHCCMDGSQCSFEKKEPVQKTELVKVTIGEVHDLLFTATNGDGAPVHIYCNKKRVFDRSKLLRDMYDEEQVEEGEITEVPIKGYSAEVVEEVLRYTLCEEHLVYSGRHEVEKFIWNTQGIIQEGDRIIAFPVQNAADKNTFMSFPKEMLDGMSQSQQVKVLRCDFIDQCLQFCAGYGFNAAASTITDKLISYTDQSKLVNYYHDLHPTMSITLSSDVSFAVWVFYMAKRYKLGELAKEISGRIARTSFAKVANFTTLCVESPEYNKFINGFISDEVVKHFTDITTRHQAQQQQQLNSINSFCAKLGVKKLIK
jgi:hypothetical protein